MIQIFYDITSSTNGPILNEPENRNHNLLYLLSYLLLRYHPCGILLKDGSSCG